MTLTILFDLDDTLLDNDIEKFLPHYLKALSEFIDTVPAEKFIHNLMQATSRMVSQSLPIATLEQTFDESFFFAIGIPKSTLKHKIEQFYREIFPSLQEFTKLRPETVRTVEFAFSNGYQVIIATNPLFPRQATNHRLAWAGLPVDKYPFALVSTYEDFHFSKSELAYIPEVLAHCGWQQQPVVFIGNSLEDDIVPAEKLGIPTYWLNPDSKTTSFNPHPMSAKGNIDDLIPWLEKLQFDKFDLNMGSLQTIIALLKSTPAALDTLFKHAHFHNRSKVYDNEIKSALMIIQQLLTEENETFFPAIRSFLYDQDYFDLNMDAQIINGDRFTHSHHVEPAVFEFIATRLSLLKLIMYLPAEVYQFKYRFPIGGNTTLQDFLTIIAERDRQQIRLLLRLLERNP